MSDWPRPREPHLFPKDTNLGELEARMERLLIRMDRIEDGIRELKEMLAADRRPSDNP